MNSHSSRTWIVLVRYENGDDHSKSLVDNTFNVKDLDDAVTAFYTGDNTVRQQAQLVLTQFQNNPDSWQVVDQILEHSSSLQAKFIGLRILEDFIIVRWNTLPMEQRLAMRNYIVKLIVNLSSNEATLRSEKTYLNKLDIVLVQILKKDWPKYWPTFIQEMVDSSQASLSLCENNMIILKLLSEEVFDYSSDSMTLSKMQKLKSQMVDEFGSIFDLCKSILSANVPETLSRAALETLLKFISWIPIQFVFQQSLIDILTRKFTESPTQRNLALQCFNEMATIDITGHPQCYDVIANVYDIVMRAVGQVDMTEDQNFVQESTLFLTTVLGKDREFIEKSRGFESVQQSLNYLLSTSQIPEREVWRMCLDYWGKLVYDVVQESSRQTTPLLMTHYADMLNRLRLLLIQNMVRPDDILLVENEDGEITREFIKQSDTTAIYKSMRHVLCLLTSLDRLATEQIIHQKISEIQFNADWSWMDLNKICWTVGSISDALTEHDENVFLESITNDLVGLLTSQQKGGDQECVVASCLLYIAGQYPRFCKTHWPFMSFVLNHISVYLLDPQSSVREMACDALLKLCRGCKQELAAPPLDGSPSILDSLLRSVESSTAQLDNHQTCMFYEAIGHVVSAAPLSAQEGLIDTLMAYSNAQFISLLGSNQASNSALVKSINQLLKINIATCKPLGPAYHFQLAKIVPTLTSCYKMGSEARKSNNNSPVYQRLHQLILDLLETYILANEGLGPQDQWMLSDIIHVILVEYASPENREARVLGLLTTVFEKIPGAIGPEILQQTLRVAFTFTLPMIKDNFVDYPEIRYEFYRLLFILCKKYFSEMLDIEDLVPLFIDSVMWGTKHTIKDISQLALKTCLDMINTAVELEDEDKSSLFFEKFYVRILRDIIEVLVDPDRRNGFNFQSQVLSRMLQIVQEGDIYTRLYDPKSVSNPLMSNVEFLQHYVFDLLCADELSASAT
ncbi:ARM repeat-containing protein [Backusella circina FSU 941]|nr:ARM repeat-containing protein [Backusella circina FSU 941]